MTYSGPVKLTPIAWGKRDQELGYAVCQHMVDATPPIVILWSPRNLKLRALLKNEHLADARIEDLDRLTDHRTICHERAPEQRNGVSPGSHIRPRIRQT